jgi:hypothetical protein
VTDVVQRADVGMIELRDGARLALEAGAHFRRGRQVRGEHLDRDVTAQPRVVRAIDFAHATRAQRSEDSVGTEDRACGEHRLPPAVQAFEDGPSR